MITSAPALTLSTPEQAALTILLLRRDTPRAITASRVIADRWDPIENLAVVTNEVMTVATGRSSRTATRYKNRADGGDLRDTHRSKIWEEVEATPQGTVYRLGGRGRELWSDNKDRLLEELQGHRAVIGIPLLEDRVLGSMASQEDLNAAYGVTCDDELHWEARIDSEGYEAAAKAASVTGGVPEGLFSLSLRYFAVTDHSMMGYVASTMGRDGTAVPSGSDLAHYAGIENERFVRIKARKVVLRTGLWEMGDGSFRYGARGLALRAAWGRLQSLGVAVDA